MKRQADEYVSEFVDEIARYKAWPMLSEYLKSKRLTSGRGIPDLYRHIEEHISTKQMSHKELRDIIKQLRLYGRKDVYLIDLSKDQIKKLKREHTGNSISENLCRILKNQNEIQKLPEIQTLIYMESTDNSLLMVFWSKRDYYVNQKIVDKSSLVSLENLGYLSSRVRGPIKRTFNVYDVFYADFRSNRAQIRIDSPEGILVEGQHPFDQLKHLIRMKTNMNEDLLTINLFPLISKIYYDKKMGHVAKLSFMTSTGSSNTREWRKGDIRTDPFQLGGERELDTPIDPYMIKVLWDPEKLVGEIKAELTLKGTRNMLYNQDKLESFGVESWTTEDSYQFIIKEISKKLEETNGSN